LRSLIVISWPELVRCDPCQVTMQTNKEIAIVWFKKDLRTEDHSALQGALQCSPHVLPLYVMEPDFWKLKDTSKRQFDFLIECLEELNHELSFLGQPLVIRTGKVTEVLETIRKTHKIKGIFSHEETGNLWTYERDLEVGRWCKFHCIPFNEIPQTGVVRRLKDRDGWARNWDSRMSQPLVGKPSNLNQVHGIDSEGIESLKDYSPPIDLCLERQTGGRSKGLVTLDSFLRDRGENYRKAMSSPVTAFDSCSRLSPYIAYGTLSLKEIVQKTKEIYQRMKEEDLANSSKFRNSLNSFKGRLHWHCHFMQKLEDEPTLEHKEMHDAFKGLRSPKPEVFLLDAWKHGQTGFPFVDACMRCLQATGWMNFRMRAMLVSFSSYNLWLHWKETGNHLARLFTDYEPGIHWPQVQMQSGTTGINSIRIYNPVKQGMDQDPTGKFTRRWVPELEMVPDSYLQEPWKWRELSVNNQVNYPEPIVDHLATAKLARQRIWERKKSKEAKQQSGKIMRKHGSRKSSSRDKKPKMTQTTMSLTV